MVRQILAAATNSPEGIQNPYLSPELQKKGGVEFFQSFLPALIGFAFIIAVIVFFFTALIGGIRWITAGGDKQAVAGAQGTLTNAIIGLVVTLSLFAIIKVIENFFATDILTIDIGALIIK